MVLCITNLVGCASKPAQLNKEKVAEIATDGNGGFTFKVETAPGKPCDNFTVWFVDSETGHSASAKSYHGFINIAKPTDIVGAKPGRYLPVRGSCNSVEHSGDYKRTYSNDFKISPRGMRPITVVAGEVTVINSLNFRLISRNSATVYVEEKESSKIKKIQSKNPQYNYIKNEN